MNIELRKYSYWPDIQQLRQEQMVDNICLAFELSITDGGKKEQIIYAVGYILIDNYENEINVSFDIPQRENDTDSFYFFREETKTIKKEVTKKTILIENNSTKMQLKRDFDLICNNEPNSLSLLVSSFLTLDVLNDISKIKPFLKNNKINFDTIEFDQFILEYSDAMIDFFSEQKLAQLLGHKYNSVNSKIVFDRLNSEMKPNNNKVKGIKI